MALYRSPETQFHVRNQSRLLSKKVKGQPRVIIWANLVVFECQMLFTKFQWYRPFGSEEEDFLKILTIYVHGGHLGHVTSTASINLGPLGSWKVKM